MRKEALPRGKSMIRKLKSGKYRLYSRKVDAKTDKRKNLGTFDTRAAAEKHERAIQFFKRKGWLREEAIFQIYLEVTRCR
jgi:hypothetical protein